MTSRRHSKKEVEDALEYAEANGWRVVQGGSHAWGKMYCPYNDEQCRCGEFCITSIWSTPKSPGNHARALRRVVDNCTTHRNADPNAALTPVRRSSPMEYTFTLKYQLVGADRDPDVLVERLGEAGCDDALVGIGQAGRLALEFTREAESAEAAVRSALRDVRETIPSARLIEVAPDFVGLTDVAEIVGLSRQYMRKLMVTHASSFPAPVHEGSASIWHLADVLAWLKGKGDYEPVQGVMDVAQVAWQVNVVKEERRLPYIASSQIAELVG